jgi:hypothetical protein
LTLEEKQAATAACEAFMGGLLKSGEFSGMRFFLQFARTHAQRLVKRAGEPPLVRSCPGKAAV